MKNPHCRIWTKAEVQNIIETLEKGSKIKRDERKNFHLTEVKNVKELRYIDRYSKGIATVHLQ